jgi:hypothetical protein
MLWIFIASIVIIGILVLVVVTMTGPAAKSIDQEKYRSKWLEIENSLTRDNQASYQLAIMNADKLLDLALRDRGVQGETMGARMKTANKRWSNANAVWAAHKLRNQVAHEVSVTVSYDAIRRHMAAYKQALKDLGAV